MGVAGYAEQADQAGVGPEAGLEPGELVELAELEAEQHGELDQAQSQAEQVAPVAYLARVSWSLSRLPGSQMCPVPVTFRKSGE